MGVEMEERIINQRVIVYKADNTPFEMTPYSLGWSIENGGVSGGDSGLDGVVMTASLTISNSVEDGYNFNPEVEMGVPQWNVYSFVGNGTNSYPGVPAGYKKGTATFNQILGDYISWDETPSTWDTFNTWNIADDTDRSNLFGEIKVVGSNFITPKIMPTEVVFEIACRSVDYSQRNPINTVDEAFAPLLDENVKVEIFAMHETPKWMNYRWYADGSNNFPNPTSGTPKTGAIGFMKAVELEYKTWDSTTSWDSWGEWDGETGESEYYTTQVVYDSNTDKIVLGKTPDYGTPIDFSITYFEEEPELQFSGYMGDSITPNPENGTISIGLRDKGKLLQDTMIDGYFVKVEPKNWFGGFEDVKIISSITLDNNGTFQTNLDHDYKVGDPIRLKSSGELPTETTEYPEPHDTSPMTGIYIVASTPTPNTFTLEDVVVATVGSGDIRSTLYVMDVEDVIQNILNDTRGINAPTLYTDFETGYDKRIQVTTDLWDSKTCWDTIQQCASMKALYLSYLYNDTTNDFELILKNVVNKTTADVALELGNIYSQTQTSTGNEVRNSILLFYYSSKYSDYRSVSAIDEASILAYGTRASIITEANTSGINTEKLAQNLCDLVLENSKDKIVESIISTPFLYKDDSYGRIGIGDTVSVDYKYLDNSENGSIPFFAIESYSHTFEAGSNDSAGRYRTEFRGNRQKVRTGKRRFIAIESRPGEYKQQIGRDLGERYSIPSVEDLIVYDKGLESVAMTPTAYAVVSFNRPANYFPAHYILEWRKSDSNPDYSEGEQRKIISLENDNYYERINLDTLTEYKFRVTAWSRGNVKGIVSDEVTITGIGDDVAPDKPVNVSVFGLDEGIEVSFDPVTNLDLLGYVVYARKDSPPVKDTEFRDNSGTYDIRKETSSIVTILSTLDPGDYYVAVSAFDTSGNESVLSSNPNVTSSPKFVVRNQADCDKLRVELESSSFVTPAYNEVVFYEGNYSFGSDLDRLSESLSIRKEGFKMTGIGKVNLYTYCEELTYSAFRVEVDNLSVSNINFKPDFISTGTSQSLFNLSGFSSVEGKITFANNDFEALDNEFRTIYISSLTTTANISGKQFYFYSNTGTGYGVNINKQLSSIRINDNDVSYPRFSWVDIDQTINSTYIMRNKITNSGIKLGGIDSGKITDNLFIYPSDSGIGTGYSVVAIDNNPMDNVQIVNNSIDCQKTISSGNKIYFVKPQRVGTSVNVSNNICKGTGGQASEDIIRNWCYDYEADSDFADVSGATVTGTGTSFTTKYTIGQAVKFGHNTTGSPGIIASFASRKVRNIVSDTELELDFAIDPSVLPSPGNTKMIPLNKELILENNSKEYESRY